MPLGLLKELLVQRFWVSTRNEEFSHIHWLNATRRSCWPYCNVALRINCSLAFESVRYLYSVRFSGIFSTLLLLSFIGKVFGPSSCNKCLIETSYSFGCLVETNKFLGSDVTTVIASQLPRTKFCGLLRIFCNTLGQARRCDSTFKFQKGDF